jgi:hypothetical protein
MGREVSVDEFMQKQHSDPTLSILWEKAGENSTEARKAKFEIKGGLLYRRHGDFKEGNSQLVLN